MSYTSRTIMLFVMMAVALAITMGVAAGIVSIAGKMQRFNECVQARQAGLNCDTKTSR